jgi:ATP-binding cassette subfamily B protein
LNELQNILITFYAASLVIGGEISLGTLVSIQYIVGQLTLPINTFVFFIQNTQDAKISLDRLKEIHNLEFEHSGKLVESIPKLKNIYLEKVCFKYGGITTKYVLNELTFEIPEGKVTAIVGKSGSGKSTIIKLLLGFYEIEKGLIKVDNLNVNDINPRIWRRSCGVVSQDGFIFNDSLLNNICESEQSLEVNYEKLRNAIRIANLEEVVNSLPNGINTKIGNQGIQLSGGQNQRVLIARAIYKDPEYFFLDEATSALDSSNEKEIMNNLFNFFRGKTAVIVAHRLSTIKNSDQIVVLNDGTVCEIGTHDELIRRKGAYFELVENQINNLNSHE